MAKNIIIAILGLSLVASQYFINRYRDQAERAISLAKTTTEDLKYIYETSVKTVKIADAFEKKWRQCIGVKK